MWRIFFLIFLIFIKTDIVYKLHILLNWNYVTKQLILVTSRTTLTFRTFSTRLWFVWAFPTKMFWNNLLNPKILLFWMLALKLKLNYAEVVVTNCLFFFAKDVIVVFQITRLSLNKIVIVIRCHCSSILWKVSVVCNDSSKIVICLLTRLWVNVLTFLSENQLSRFCIWWFVFRCHLWYFDYRSFLLFKFETLLTLEFLYLRFGLSRWSARFSTNIHSMVLSLFNI